VTKGTLKQPARDTIGAEAYASHVGLHPWSRAELRELSDNALLAQVRALPRNSELRAAACEILVDRYHKLVRSCVRQYRGSPEPTEDLMQVGYVGLLKAINNCPAHLPVRRHGGDGLTASGVNPECMQACLPAPGALGSPEVANHIDATRDLCTEPRPGETEIVEDIYEN